MKKRLSIIAIMAMLFTVVISTGTALATTFPSVVRVRLFGQSQVIKINIQGDAGTAIDIQKANGLHVGSSGNWSVELVGGILRITDPNGNPADDSGPVIVTNGPNSIGVYNANDGTRRGGYKGSIYIYPNVGSGTLDVINYVNFDPDYLNGISEMPSSWPYDALYAQAIAARSYAIATLKPGDRFDLYDDVNSQVYTGVDKTNSMMGDRWAKAVADTKGQVLTYNGEVIPAYFFSSCGGATENIEDAWPRCSPKPYLKSISDKYKDKDGNEHDYCDDSSNSKFAWSPTISGVAGKLEITPGRVVTAIDVTQRSVSGRVKWVNVTSINGTDTASANVSSITGNSLRQKLGLNSTLINQITRVDTDTFTFTGNGWGHGVGMCQWGARGRAQNGQNYMQILSAYYPGTQITNFNTYYVITIPANRKNVKSVQRNLKKRTGYSFDRLGNYNLQISITNEDVVRTIAAAAVELRTKAHITKVSPDGSTDVTDLYQPPRYSKNKTRTRAHIRSYRGGRRSTFLHRRSSRRTSRGSSRRTSTHRRTPTHRKRHR